MGNNNVLNETKMASKMTFRLTFLNRGLAALKIIFWHFRASHHLKVNCRGNYC